MIKNFFVAIIAAVAVFTASAPATAQTWSDTRVATTGTTGGTAPTSVPIWGQAEGTPIMNPYNGQYVQNGQVYQPQQTNNLNITTSGCQHNLLNALACMGMQGLTQMFVNRDSVSAQAKATIRVDQARFNMSSGGATLDGRAYTPPASGGICRLTMPDGRTQDIRVQTPVECQQAVAAAGGVMR